MKKIVLNEDITSENAYDVKRNLIEESKNSDGIIVDFKNVNTIDSTGLGILVSTLKKLQEQNKKMSLTNVKGNVKRVFELTRLDTLFDIH